MKETQQTKFKFLEKFLSDKKFFGGDSVKFPDFHLYEILYQLSVLFTDLFEEFPKLKAYLERFEALPAIQAYMRTDKYVAKPFNGPSAKFNPK